MNNFESLSHTTWDCKYHLIWIPKYRKKVLYGHLRKHLTDVLHELASHRESKIHEGHLKGDHVHMLVSIPPKYSVSQVVGYIKGKSAIHVAGTMPGERKTLQVRVSGPGDTMFQQLVETRRPSANISAVTRNSTRGMIN